MQLKADFAARLIRVFNKVIHSFRGYRRNDLKYSDFTTS